MSSQNIQRISADPAFSNPVVRWLDCRLPILTFLHHEPNAHPTPRLAYAGAQAPEGIWLALSRIGATYYFVHFFVVLPVVGVIERLRPLPIIISEPTLPATGSARP
jgi:hypothetical protein